MIRRLRLILHKLVECDENSTTASWDTAMQARETDRLERDVDLELDATGCPTLVEIMQFKGRVWLSDDVMAIGIRAPPIHEDVNSCLPQAVPTYPQKMDDLRRLLLRAGQETLEPRTRRDYVLDASCQAFTGMYPARRTEQSRVMSVRS